MRDECSHWWDTDSPRGALPPAAPPKYHSQDWLPSACTTAQRSGEEEGCWEGEKPPCSKVFWGSEEGGKLVSDVIPTANSFYPMLFICSSPFCIPFLTRLCSFPTQHRFQISNPPLQSRPKQPHLKYPLSALVTQ